MASWGHEWCFSSVLATLNVQPYSALQWQMLDLSDNVDIQNALVRGARDNLVGTLLLMVGPLGARDLLLASVRTRHFAFE